MAKKHNKLGKWDLDNQSHVQWDEGDGPCFKLWPTEGMNTALLDADMFPYIVGFSQSDKDWQDVTLRAGQLKVHEDELDEWLHRQPECARALNHCDALVNNWTGMIEGDSAIPFLTCGDSQFRFDVAFSKEYKGKRNPIKPPFYRLIRWHLAKNHKAILCYVNEADDEMSIVQTKANMKLLKESGLKGGNPKLRSFSCTTICTKDKDLPQSWGWHSNPDINKGEPYWVDEVGELLPEYHPVGHEKEGQMKKLGGNGLKFFYAQLLMGDVVDNYGGLPGCGMVASFRVLDELTKKKDLHRRVEVMYKNRFTEKPFYFKTFTGKQIKVTWKDMLAEQGRLAWMQRKRDDLWMPEHRQINPKKWRKKK